jgi:SAM-dependent methyltransferase
MQTDPLLTPDLASGLPPDNPAADSRFRQLLRAAGMKDDQRFGGGYVQWEWNHCRHLFTDLPVSLIGARVLELGCNIGATAVVLALLGAEVTAVDIHRRFTDVAEANAARFGVSTRVSVCCVEDTRRMHLDDGAFDLVSCNSVLEYVPRPHLEAVLAEAARVLRPAGLLVVVGTSNRLWPREQHSRQWLSNYLPRWIDGWWPGSPLRRGLTGGEIRAALPGFTDLLAADPQALIRFKRRLGCAGPKLALLSAAARAGALAGVSLGTLLPTLTMVLQAPGRDYFPSSASDRATTWSTEKP